MLTLNRLITEIRTFQSNHDQLKSWVFGDPWEANAKHEVQYPLLFGMIQPSSTNGTKETFSISFTVCDREKTDRSNTLNVLSNCKQIANDLVVYFKQNTSFTDFFQVDEQITFEPFIESFDDNCAGWTFTVNFNQPFEWDLCGVPVTGNPANLSEEGVKVYDQNNNLLFTKYDGEVLIVNNLTTVTETYTVTGTTQALNHTPSIIYGVYMNGQNLNVTTDYTITGATLTFVVAKSSDVITVTYAY